MSRVEHIGDATLYLGNCLEILPTLGPVDAVVTDPPYGNRSSRNHDNHNVSRSGRAAARNYGAAHWDTKPPSGELINQILHMGRHQIIFGGNYFDLPASPCWLVWDKLNGMNDFADCELAWTNLDKAVRRVQWRWNGMIRQGDDVREHPTQKPEGVMKWCLEQLPPDARLILDPFMGSGTTGVACAKLGREFIGIEIEEKYFDIACKRIDDAYKQADLFIERPTSKPKQEAMEI